MSALIRSYSLVRGRKKKRKNSFGMHKHKQIQEALISPPCHGKVNRAHIFTRSVALPVMNVIIGQVSSVWTIEYSRRSHLRDLIRVLVLTLMLIFIKTVALEQPPGPLVDH